MERARDIRSKAIYCIVLAAVMVAGIARPAAAQDRLLYRGSSIPPDVEAMYLRGIQYLTKSQETNGSWTDSKGRQPGVVALAVLAIMAHGDDPNYGPTRLAVRRGIDFLISSSQPQNGYIGPTMYNHGFATLALAEAYGQVDDARIGPTLKKAIGLILTSQASNPQGGWRYSPTSQDADTTVSGAQFVALIAARNAGMAVPEDAVQKALKFYHNAHLENGGFMYTIGNESPSPPRTAIGTLVLALAKEKDTTEFKISSKRLEGLGYNVATTYPYYYLYYASQAYFHARMDIWDEWNKRNVEVLKNTQNEDGSWSGNNGQTFSTSAALLSLAVGYRLLPIYER